MPNSYANLLRQGYGSQEIRESKKLRWAGKVENKAIMPD
jgi:hypothetical protein